MLVADEEEPSPAVSAAGERDGVSRGVEATTARALRPRVLKPVGSHPEAPPKKVGRAEGMDEVPAKEHGSANAQNADNV